jgi:hypothetical protein
VAQVVEGLRLVEPRLDGALYASSRASRFSSLPDELPQQIVTARNSKKAAPGLDSYVTYERWQESSKELHPHDDDTPF